MSPDASPDRGDPTTTPPSPACSPRLPYDRLGGLPPHLGFGTRWLLPNALSLVRIGLAVLFPWIAETWRPYLIVAAGLSDLLDGVVSRAFTGTSTLGQILDPVADKLFVGAVLITLLLDGSIGLIDLFLVGFRDLAVALGSAVSVVRHGWGAVTRMPPSWLGKLATAGQFGFVLTLTLGFDVESTFCRSVEFVAAACSVLAGLDYLRRNHLEAGDDEGPELQHP